MNSRHAHNTQKGQVVHANNLYQLVACTCDQSAASRTDRQDLHPVLTRLQQENLEHYKAYFDKVLKGAREASFDTSDYYCIVNLTRRPTAVFGELICAACGRPTDLFGELACRVHGSSFL